MSKNCDALRIYDCAKCRVSPAQFGELCAICHYTARANRRMDAPVRPDAVLERAALVLAWITVSVLCAAAIVIGGWLENR